MKRSAESIIADLTAGFRGEERETSILIDHHARVVHFETTDPYTARRWYSLFSELDQVTFETQRDSFGMSFPVECCRKPELIVRAEYRKQTAQHAGSDSQTHDPTDAGTDYRPNVDRRFTGRKRANTETHLIDLDDLSSDLDDLSDHFDADLLPNDLDDLSWGT